MLYKFIADFDGSLDVSLNISYYTFLKLVGKTYADAIVAALATDFQAQSSHRRALSEDLLGETTAGSSSSATPDNVRATTEDSQGSRERLPHLTFRALIPIQLEPQLKALGEATPRLEKVLEWLGWSAMPSR